MNSVRLRSGLHYARSRLSRQYPNSRERQQEIPVQTRLHRQVRRTTIPPVDTSDPCPPLHLPQIPLHSPPLPRALSRASVGLQRVQDVRKLSRQWSGASCRDHRALGGTRAAWCAVAMLQGRGEETGRQDAGRSWTARRRLTPRAGCGAENASSSFLPSCARFARPSRPR